MRTANRLPIYWLGLLVVAYPLLETQAQRASLYRPPELNEETIAAIESGLKFLISEQNADGSFGDAKYGIAVTSFACLALMADGNVPGRGRYGAQVKKGLDFILDQVGETGYITRQDDQSRMHGHGFAALFLAEVYGMTPDRRQAASIRQKLHAAVWLSIQAQERIPERGWGYYPTSAEHEGSVTVGQLQALRAARNVGLLIPKRCVDEAVEYVRKSANPDGSFKYRLGMSTVEARFPLTAAGVSSLNATGEYDGAEIRRGLELMMKYCPPNGITDRYYDAFYEYGQFYAAQAMYHAPRHYWDRWFPAIREEILGRQDKVTGAWTSSRFGSTYATAVATLVMQIPYNYLPIFQR